jgi:2-oxoisovalerate ferredoxin oxidoreductase beta subunit
MADVGKPKSFFPVYERKPELQHQTHYCPGCGHGIIHKMVGKAIDKLGIQDRTILVGPVGCSVFTYYYFDVGNIQAAHGRAPAVATAVKRSRPGAIVIGYQGDGDLSAIGTAEIVHAANRGENITVIFVNNAIYGMTGGQMAPTTLVGQKSTTAPLGRDPLHDGYPLRMSELLATLDAPVYIERVALGDNKLLARADKAIHRAIENQVKGLGFSLVEVLSPCPTGWKMEPVEAQRWVRDVMSKTFPIAVFRDRTKEAAPRVALPPPPPLERIPEILGIAGDGQTTNNDGLSYGLQIRVAGFGGQGVLLLGEVLAEAGLDAGMEVSWLPSYGPEMRSGTSNCHVRISRDPIDSPLVTKPDVLFALNEPSLRKFLPSVAPGGWVVYNGDRVPEGCLRPDIHTIARDFTEAAEAVGGARVANMVMLGALLQATGILPMQHVIAALRRLVKNLHFLAIDRRALERGAELIDEGDPHESGSESEHDCVLQ